MTSRKEDMDDNPELTNEEFARMRPAAEVLPAEVMNAFRRTRGPQKIKPTKEMVTVRLDPDVLQQFRNTGRGWQTRLNDCLRDVTASFHVLRDLNGFWAVRLPRGETLPRVYKTQDEAVEAASLMAKRAHSEHVNALVVLHVGSSKDRIAG